MYHSRLQVICDQEYAEILMAEVAEAGFDTFMETDKGFEAYVELDKYDKEKLLEIKDRYSPQTPVVFYQDRIQKRNWNEEWEKSYHPIIVENQCLIRAEFHKIEQKYPYEIVITPKMSFGTGHHQTTYLMVKSQMKLNHQGKRVMDAGCGTAILSILASKLGAQEVFAFDIDEWSVTNGIENIEVNECSNITLKRGKISEVDPTGKFDIILANINKNILLEELETYHRYLTADGCIVLSGFYTRDISDLMVVANRCGLVESARDEREEWAALVVRPQP